MRASWISSGIDIATIVPNFPAGKNIPKLIHQTVPDKNKIPAEIRDNMTKIAADNPSWHHRLYDDEDIKIFIISNYGDKALALINSISPKYGVCMADAFRYLVVYKDGGAYIDAKCRITQPLESILREDDQYLLSQWNNLPGGEFTGFGLWPDLATIPGGEFQQWHVIAVSGHPFLRAVIEAVFRNIRDYSPWLHGSGQTGVLRTTGPIAYTLAIYPLLSKHPHRFINTGSQIGLEYSIFRNLNHKNLLSKHYTRLTTPIVSSSTLGDVIYIVYTNIMVVVRKFSRVLRRFTKASLKHF